jgi:hypothetical protein
MAMNPVTLRTNRGLMYVSFSLPLLVFLIQVVLPNGWALAGLYLAPMAVAALWSSFRHSFLVVSTSLASTILATIAFFASPYWDNGLLFVTSYLLPIAMLWFLTVVSLFRKARERQTAVGNTRRTVCPFCAVVRSEGGDMPLERYGPRHLGSIVCIGICPACQKRLPHDLPTQIHLRA